MSPEDVLARLRQMSALSQTEASPMPRGVDMRPAAVVGRLRDMAEVSALCSKLAAARRDS